MLKPFHSLYDDTVRAAGEIRPCRCVGFDNLEISARGAKVLGVAKSAASVGDNLAVTLIGMVSVETGSEISRGDNVIGDENGCVVVATGASDEHVCGLALSAASGSGQFVEILIR